LDIVRVSAWKSSLRTSPFDSLAGFATLASITWVEDGFHLKFGGGGTIVEWAAHLRRFDENRTLDRLVKRNELNLEIIAELAGVVAASHRRAPIISSANAGKALQRQIEGATSP
jgi:aminoglycoside phosphotransferase family enzyme